VKQELARALQCRDSARREREKAMNSKCCFTSIAALAIVTGCGSSGGSTSNPEYRIVVADGGAPAATEGEALRLAVVEVNADGTTKALPSGATVAWSGPPVVTALAEGSSPAQSALPQPGSAATGMWVRNPEHLTDAQINGVLYVIDKGTGPNPSIEVTADVSGGAPAGKATVAIPVGPFPTGDVTRGQSIYGDNCASCHASHGEGTTLAPPLNDSSDSQGSPNVAADPDWNGPLFAITPMDNMDNEGVSLAVAMPRWLITEARSGQLLTAQDFADIYAYLKTQTTPSP
jgi:mono/diheme cytochrome c family protein